MNPSSTRSISTAPILLGYIAFPPSSLLIAFQAEHLCALDVVAYGDRLRRRLLQHYPAQGFRENQRVPALFAHPFSAYIDGEYDALQAIPILPPRGTPFQQAVWTALRRIPAGQTLSYQAVAHSVGSPRASRAVGQANHSNPLPIVIPCHRVIHANGALSGYASGVALKRWLLEHEGAAAGVRRSTCVEGV